MQPLTLDRRARLALAFVIAGAIASVLAGVLALILPWVWHTDLERIRDYFLATRIVPLVEAAALAIAGWLLLAVPRARAGARTAMVLFGIAFVMLAVQWALAVLGFEPDGSPTHVHARIFRLEPVVELAALVGLALALRGLGRGLRVRWAAKGVAALAIACAPIPLWNAVAPSDALVHSYLGVPGNEIVRALVLLGVAIVLRLQRRHTTPLPPRAVVVKSIVLACALLVPWPAHARGPDEVAAITALRDRDELDAALARWTTAVEADPDNGALQALGAELLLRANRLGEARVAIERARILGDERVDTLALDGHVLLLLGEDVAARFPLERALALAPGHRDARTDLDLVERLAALRVPGGQPSDPGPGRAVDELVRAVAAHATPSELLDQAHPIVLARLARALPEPRTDASVRRIAEDALRSVLADSADVTNVIGYRIANTTVDRGMADVDVEVATWHVGAQAERREPVFHQLTFAMRQDGDRWLVDDVTLDDGTRLSAELARMTSRRSVATMVPRDDRRVPMLEMLTILASGSILLWLAIRLLG
ncbi:MAG TPA: hypothetical protein VFQ53_35460 [Kofleriaceae bacterium]|nr:hypothetical protein [Kofleriaceae bacterium]